MNSIEAEIKEISLQKERMVQAYQDSSRYREFMKYLSEYYEHQRLIFLCAHLLDQQTERDTIRQFFTERTIRKAEQLISEYRFLPQNEQNQLKR